MKNIQLNLLYTITGISVNLASSIGPAVFAGGKALS